MTESDSNQTPYIFQHRGIETDTSLPEPTIGIYEAPDPRYKSGEFNPDYELQRRAIYTPEGFVPPVDSTFATDYLDQKSENKDLTPHSTMFSPSLTSVIKPPTEIAKKVTVDEVEPIEVGGKAHCVKALQQHSDLSTESIPIYLPDMQTNKLGRYLALPAVSCVTYIPKDEEVNTYTLGKKVAEVYGVNSDIGYTAAEFAIGGDFFGDNFE